MGEHAAAGLILLILSNQLQLGVVACRDCRAPPTDRPVLHRPGGQPPAPSTGRCPIDALKLAACVDLLNGLVNVVVGGRELKRKCCPVIRGVAGLDAALCLCTTIRAKLLNLNIILPLALELLVGCGKTVPPGFRCPPLH